MRNSKIASLPGGLAETENIATLIKKDVKRMEKPILFNTDMVNALLKGHKTCTRRLVKEPPAHNELLAKVENKFYLANDDKEWQEATGGEYIGRVKHEIKPIYNVGDILYVRETWKITSMSNFDKKVKFLFKAEPNSVLKEVCLSNKRYSELIKFSDKNGWQPSLFMPKEATRIFIKVTDIRVERLQDITEEQAKFEGAMKKLWYQPFRTKKESQQKYVGNLAQHEPNYKTGFADIWDSTLGKWDWMFGFNENPWVWVIEFERVNS